MQVKIEKKFEVKKPVKSVWEFLSDPRKVATCVPGAQITEAIDNRRYLGSMNIKVGPVVAGFKGEVVIERLDAKNFVIELVGQGRDVKGKGNATMKMVGKLKALNLGSTEVMGSSEISATGLMAQLGSRMVEEVSIQMFEQFTRNLQRNFADSEGPLSDKEDAQALRAVPLLASAGKAAFVNFFRRITGRP